MRRRFLTHVCMLVTLLAWSSDAAATPATPSGHAEAAYSAAGVLRFGARAAASAEQLGQTFVLPAYTPWQKEILDTAVRFVGYPYVWGGESETTTSPYGPQVHGGFDCSGFVWR